MSTTSILLPGQPLPQQFNTNPLPQVGKGCYVDQSGRIIASVVGRPVRDGQTVSVQTSTPTSHPPTTDSVVTGLISRLTPQQATLTLLTVDGHPTPSSQEDYQGLIRLTDVRLTERDKVKMGECFRLGDLVKAKVISLGDARSYYLSTADNELGVISATSEAGNPLVPASWQEMQDTITGTRERRKVAKPEGV